MLLLFLILMPIVFSLASEFEKEEQPNLTKLPSCLKSVKKLNDTYELEKALAKNIIEIYDDLESRKKLEKYFVDTDNHIKSYCNSIIKRHEKESQSNQPFVYHAINIFHFVNRIVTEFNPLLDLMDEAGVRSNVYRELKRLLLNNIVINECWLTQKDIVTSRAQLVKLWITYQPNLGAFFEGDINGFKSSEPLSWEEIKSLLIYLYEEELHEHLVTMVNFLLKEKSELINLENLKKSLVKMKANSLRKLNQFDEAIKTLEEYNKVHNDPNIKRDIDNNKLEKSSGRHWEVSEILQREDTFMNICRGFYKNPILDCTLTCPLKGWFCIKEEIIKKKPLIKLMHNSLGEQDRENLIEMSSERLHLNRQSSSLSSDSDISANTPMRSFNTCLEKLDKEISFVLGNEGPTGSRKSQIKPLRWYQIYNYGYYDVFSMPENDTYIPQVLSASTVKKTNRIATWITFLSEPACGGGIAFIDEKILIPANKGSSLVWYNRYKKGIRVTNIRNKPCPILVGDKWIAKRWFREDTRKYIQKCASRSA